MLSHRQPGVADAPELLQLGAGPRGLYRRRGAGRRVRGVPLPLSAALLPQGTHEETTQESARHSGYEKTRNRIEYAATKSGGKSLAKKLTHRSRHTLSPEGSGS